MTREQAKDLLPIIKAYAEGKQIQWLNHCKEWIDIDEKSGLCIEWSSDVYRIKPTYRPFKDKDECWNEMLKHQPFGWKKYKSDGELSCITFICDETNFIDAYEKLTFADGTPFGIKEE